MYLFLKTLSTIRINITVKYNLFKREILYLYYHLPIIIIGLDILNCSFALICDINKYIM